ncbi:family 16 glycosylhydrolase [Pseudonocardia hispaniensis]|uniref:Family 16 glycosylhydrolase n=1 Tax=Pseudonocardia hispaniensis TaxID=904933 RepID=A0ABW1J4W2_9PSEU
MVLTALAVIVALAMLTVPIVIVRGLLRLPPGQPAERTAPTVIDTSDPVAPSGRAELDRATRSPTEAAIVYDWPLLLHDEFDGDTLDTAHWHPYSGSTTGGNGRHRPSNISVADGVMTITSRGRESAGMAWQPGQLYGRWEVRARTEVGTGYGAVILLWPDAEDFPEGGEIDFMEIPKPSRTESNFVLHYGHSNSQVGTSVQGDFTEWHNYAVEWTPDHVAGFIDGQEIFRSVDRAQIPPRAMHLAIQQDIGPYGKDWIPPLDETSPAQVRLHVDWVRIYGL